MPRPLAEEREKALCEETTLRNAALALDVRERVRARVNAAHAKSDIRLDRGRQVSGSFEPDRPCAVVAHARHQLVRNAAVEIGRAQAEHVVPEKMLRRHRHVRLELAHPDAVGALQLEQPPRAPIDRVVERSELCQGGHAFTLARALLKTC